MKDYNYSIGMQKMYKNNYKQYSSKDFCIIDFALYLNW